MMRRTHQNRWLITVGTLAVGMVLPSGCIDPKKELLEPQNPSIIGPDQVNFVVPSATGTGAALVTITSGSGATATANLDIASVAPSVFTMPGGTVAAAVAPLRSIIETLSEELAVERVPLGFHATWVPAERLPGGSA